MTNNKQAVRGFKERPDKVKLMLFPRDLKRIRCSPPATERKTSLTRPKSSPPSPNPPPPLPQDPVTWTQIKKNWLSDPGAYPVVVIITGAMVFCAVVGTRCLATNPDVRINKKKRASILRYWGNGGDGVPPPKALGGPQY